MRQPQNIHTEVDQPKSGADSRASRARQGGFARSQAMTPRQRQESARKAVNARWQRYRKAKQDQEAARISAAA
jgi:hypothetical protein